MEIVLSGLILGFMGSFHCAGMCGPIAISMPLRGNTIFQKVFGGLLYNFGRTLTYGLMGAFFGLIGQGFHMAGFQQGISVAMGAIMILSVTMPFLFKNIKVGNFDFFTGKIRTGIQKLFQKRSFGGLFLIGLLNGLLPCGLVYMAIAGAIGTANIYYGILFMILFGLGTIPMMLFISLVGNMISITIRNRINKIIPYVVVFVGLIFILRGLSLGIPYLSPPAEKLQPGVHMMKHKDSKEAMKESCCHSEDSTKID